jgi:hypothetical protein
VLEAKTSSIIQLEGEIRILEAKLKSVDTTKMRRHKKNRIRKRIPEENKQQLKKKDRRTPK